MNPGIRRAFSYFYVFVFAFVVIIAVVSSPLVPAGIDWCTVLRPATLAFLHLKNPYQIQGAFNPPWLFMILAPIAILPESAGGTILLWLNLITWVFVTKKLGNGKWLPIITVITSPMVVNGLLARNVDFLVMWGLLLPAELAVFFLLIKPQVGGVALLYLAIRAFQTGGWKKLGRLFILPFLLTTVSFVSYGLWPLNAQNIINLPWNASPLKMFGWPSLVIGFFLFILAINQKHFQDGENISMASSIFFSPYVGSQSWVAILPSLLKKKVLYIVWIVLWAWVMYRTFR